MPIELRIVKQVERVLRDPEFQPHTGSIITRKDDKMATFYELETPMIGCITPECQAYLDALKAHPPVFDGHFDAGAVCAALADVYDDGMRVEVATSLEEFTARIVTYVETVQASAQESARASVWESVRESVRDTVWESVWEKVRDTVWESVSDTVWDSVWDSVRVSIQESARDAVLASVREKVRASTVVIRDLIQDSGWAVYYAAYLRLLPAEGRAAHLSAQRYLDALVTAWRAGLGYWIRLGDTLLALPFPPACAERDYLEGK